MSTASTLTSVGSWECVAAEFGEKDTENEGLVAFWVRMPEPRLCKADADLIGAAPRLLGALKQILESPVSDLCCGGNCADPLCPVKRAQIAVAHAEGRP